MIKVKNIAELLDLVDLIIVIETRAGIPLTIYNPGTYNNKYDDEDVLELKPEANCITIVINK